MLVNLFIKSVIRKLLTMTYNTMWTSTTILNVVHAFQLVTWFCVWKFHQEYIGMLSLVLVREIHCIRAHLSSIQTWKLDPLKVCDRSYAITCTRLMQDLWNYITWVLTKTQKHTTCSTPTKSRFLYWMNESYASIVNSSHPTMWMTIENTNWGMEWWICSLLV